MPAFHCTLCDKVENIRNITVCYFQTSTCGHISVNKFIFFKLFYTIIIPGQFQEGFWGSQDPPTSHISHKSTKLVVTNLAVEI